MVIILPGKRGIWHGDSSRPWFKSKCPGSRRPLLSATVSRRQRKSLTHRNSPFDFLLLLLSLPPPPPHCCRGHCHHEYRQYHAHCATIVIADVKLRCLTHLSFFSFVTGSPSLPIMTTKLHMASVVSIQNSELTLTGIMWHTSLVLDLYVCLQ